jgi:uncharacterized Zn-binding protein involved in type VI secretion
MPGYALQVGASLNCSHGGTVQVATTNSRVLVNKQPVLTVGDTWSVVGCPLNVAGAPSPCATLVWISPSVRVKVNGQPVVSSGSTGLSMGPVPQGSPIVISQQTRVSVLT